MYFATAGNGSVHGAGTMDHHIAGSDDIDTTGLCLKITGIHISRTDHLHIQSFGAPLDPYVAAAG